VQEPVQSIAKIAGEIVKKMGVEIADFDRVQWKLSWKKENQTIYANTKPIYNRLILI
jgi:hypothetical protein